MFPSETLNAFSDFILNEFIINSLFSSGVSVDGGNNAQLNTYRHELVLCVIEDRDPFCEIPLAHTIPS